MAASLLFYDLETSGIYPDSARIMQFAGQRTDLDLNPIEDPINILIKLPKDSLPDPTAVLVHGISPQQTVLEGLSEAEFLQYFHAEIVRPDTTFVGFNNVRFDDEFIRYLNYRNLYDPYGWSWENNCSRWDILDLVRLTRALRPDGINWPIDKTGANTNRLEMLTRANKLNHEAAHDALSDVQATIAVAKLIKQTQPKLYNYLYKLRLKTEASKLVNSQTPFVYTSSHYSSAQLHTTVVVKLGDHPDRNCALVYDLREDPTPWLSKSGQELADSWRYTKDRDLLTNPPLPVKTMRLNRCPAVAPLGVIKDDDTKARLGLDMKIIEHNLALLNEAKDAFGKELRMAVEILNQEQSARQQSRQRSVDERLYDGLINDKDKLIMAGMHHEESPESIRRSRESYSDERLKQLCGFYLARNYYSRLSSEERAKWDDYVNRKLFAGGDSSRLAFYFQRINQLAQQRTDSRSQLLLEDLKLYGESLIPSDLG